MHTWPYPLGIKVFNVDLEANIEPDITITGVLKERAKKHINFDIYVNGACFSGNPIKEQLDIFESCEEFVINNQLILGLEIQELIYSMQNNLSFNDYYHIIKKCIRLAAYVCFNSDSTYYSSTRECFEFAMQHNKNICHELTFLFDSLFIQATQNNIKYIEKLKKKLFLFPI